MNNDTLLEWIMSDLMTQALVKEIHDQVMYKPGQNAVDLDMEYFQRLHRAGANIQTAFGALCDQGIRYNDTRRAKIATWLIRSGVNPLLCLRFKDELAFARGQDFFGACLVAIAQREQLGFACRRDGENIFHLLHDTLPSFRIALGCLPNHPDILKNWLLEASPKSQATPIHMLWRHQLKSFKDAKQKFGNKGIESHSSIMPGNLQYVVVEALRSGADYFQEDDEGLTMFDLIGQTNALGLGSLKAPPWGSWEQMTALLEQYQLNRDTAPTTPQESSRPPRL